MVGIDTSGKIVGLQTLLSEHTSSYYDMHTPYFDNLSGVAIDSYETVDTISGATLSLNLIKQLLDAVKAVA
ncbi:MAG: FMN-binding protein [Acholeplasmataceae bacterium]|nr:FMN-binding protein [Acholeplasmataceae bacterium]